MKLRTSLESSFFFYLSFFFFKPFYVCFFYTNGNSLFFFFLVTGFQTASTLFASSFCLSFFPFFFFCFFLVFQECSLHHKQFFLTSVVPLRRYLSLFSLRFFFFFAL